MRNILNEKPINKLTARLNFSTRFVLDKDIIDNKVLDIGCGFGWFDLNALGRGVKQIVGIEISDDDLKAAKIIKDKRAIFKVGEALKLPFKDNYFDTVVAWEVIEHIPKNTENQMFKEVKRVLKKKGSFYLSTPYDSFWSKYTDPAWWLIAHRHYSKNQLISFGRKNQFRVLDVYIKGSWWNLLNILNLYFSKWILKRKQLLGKQIGLREEQEFKNNDGFMEIFIKYEKQI